MVFFLNLSLLPTLEPSPSINFAKSRLEFLVAKSMGEFPSLSRMLAIEPLSSNKATTNELFSSTAMCNSVDHLWFLASGLASRSSSNVTISVLLSEAAMCKAVLALCFGVNIGTSI